MTTEVTTPDVPEQAPDPSRHSENIPEASQPALALKLTQQFKQERERERLRGVGGDTEVHPTITIIHMKSVPILMLACYCRY